MNEMPVYDGPILLDNNRRAWFLVEQSQGRPAMGQKWATSSMPGLTFDRSEIDSCGPVELYWPAAKDNPGPQPGPEPEPDLVADVMQRLEPLLSLIDVPKLAMRFSRWVEDQTKVDPRARP